MMNRGEHPPFKHTWLKAHDPLPDNPEVHLALLAYMSDLDFMSTSMLPHGPMTVDEESERTIRGASAVTRFGSTVRSGPTNGCYSPKNHTQRGRCGLCPEVTFLIVRGRWSPRRLKVFAVRPIGNNRQAIEAAQKAPNAAFDERLCVERLSVLERF